MAASFEDRMARYQGQAINVMPPVALKQILARLGAVFDHSMPRDDLIDLLSCCGVDVDRPWSPIGETIQRRLTISKENGRLRVSVWPGIGGGLQTDIENAVAERLQAEILREQLALRDLEIQKLRESMGELREQMARYSGEKSQLSKRDLKLLAEAKSGSRLSEALSKADLLRIIEDKPSSEAPKREPRTARINPFE